MVSLLDISLLIAALLGLLHLLQSLRAGLRSPLAFLPGPWHTRFTGLPHLLSRATGRSVRLAQGLHKWYGTVVRVGPTGVSVNSPVGYHTIHGAGSQFEKTPIFDRIRFGNGPMLFTIRNRRQHAERRRLIGRGFAAVRAADDWETRIRDLVDLAVERIRSEAAKEGLVDVYKWWRLLAVDVIADMAYGESFGLVWSGDKPDFLEALEYANLRVVLQVMLPGPILSLWKLSPVRWHRIVGWAKEVMFFKASTALQELKLSCQSRQSMFGPMLEKAKGYGDDQNALTLDDDAISSEAAMMMVAGSDSTAAVLTYAVWEVLRRPDLRRRLENEVAGLKSDFEVRDVESLPLLNGVIEETLRLYNPAGAPVERLVPQGGCLIDGWYLPEGTTVYTQSWLLSRSEDVFPHADRFDERRFDSLTPEQKKIHVPFGIGARSCIGMQLARTEIRLALAVFFRVCRSARLERMTDDMMTQSGEFFIVPKAGKCCIALGNEKGEV